MWCCLGPCASDPTCNTKAVQRTARMNRKVAVPRACLESISSLWIDLSTAGLLTVNMVTAEWCSWLLYHTTPPPVLCCWRWCVSASCLQGEALSNTTEFASTLSWLWGAAFGLALSSPVSSWSAVGALMAHLSCFGCIQEEWMKLKQPRPLCSSSQGTVRRINQKHAPETNWNANVHALGITQRSFDHCSLLPQWLWNWLVNSAIQPVILGQNHGCSVSVSLRNMSGWLGKSPPKGLTFLKGWSASSAIKKGLQGSQRETINTTATAKTQIRAHTFLDIKQSKEEAEYCGHLLIHSSPNKLLPSLHSSQCVCGDEVMVMKFSLPSHSHAGFYSGKTSHDVLHSFPAGDKVQSQEW